MYRRAKPVWSVEVAPGGYAVARTCCGVTEYAGRDVFWTRSPQHVLPLLTRAEAEAAAAQGAESEEGR